MWRARRLPFMVLANRLVARASHHHRPPVRETKHHNSVQNTPSLGMRNNREVFAWFVAPESLFCWSCWELHVFWGNVPPTLSKGEQ